MKSYLYLIGEVTFDSVAKPLRRVSELGPGDEAELRICSEGGDCDAGYALIDAIRTSPARVTTIAMGATYSVALDILVSGDHRVAMPLAIGMSHLAYVPGKRHKRRPKSLQLEDWRGLKLYLDKTRFKSEEGLRSALFNGKDVYFNADQMLDLTLVDEVRRIK